MTTRQRQFRQLTVTLPFSVKAIPIVVKGNAIIFLHHQSHQVPAECPPSLSSNWTKPGRFGGYTQWALGRHSVDALSGHSAGTQWLHSVVTHRALSGIGGVDGCPPICNNSMLNCAGKYYYIDEEWTLEFSKNYRMENVPGRGYMRYFTYAREVVSDQILIV